MGESASSGLRQSSSQRRLSSRPKQHVDSEREGVPIRRLRSTNCLLLRPSPPLQANRHRCPLPTQPQRCRRKILLLRIHSQPHPPVPGKYYQMMNLPILWKLILKGDIHYIGRLQLLWHKCTKLSQYKFWIQFNRFLSFDSIYTF
jgi:hypothetical protein